MDRIARILTSVDLSLRGLEIGALHHPIVTPDRLRNGGEVLYVDHASTEDLLAKYENDPDVGDIVKVDVVWAGNSLAAALGDRAPLDWVVASHVAEHIPDLVGWLEELAGVLRPGGRISLAIPDKRFCFDIRRPETDPSAVIDAHLARRRQPTPGQVYDFWSRMEQVDALVAWEQGYDFSTTDDRYRQGLEWADRAQGDSYIDVHCWVLTPTSFVAVLRTLVELDLIRFEVASFTPTRYGELEFFCVLERLPDDLDPAARRAQQLASLPTAADLASSPRPNLADRVPTGGTGNLSPREARLIERKRAIMGVVRNTGRRRRHR